MAPTIGSTTLYQRGKVWWGRCHLAGIEHRCTLRTGDRREAATRYKAWRLKLERTAIGNPEAPTFRQAAVQWAEEVLPKSVKASVAQRYLVSVRQLEPVFGSLRVDQITPEVIGDYIRRRGLTASNATVQRDLTALSRLLSACVTWGWRQDNPVSLYDRSSIRERRDPITLPRPQDVDMLLAACPPGMAALLRLLDLTGMRKAEAVTLDADNVDLESRTIKITRTKTGRPRVITFVTPGGDVGTVLDSLPRTRGAIFRSRHDTPYALGSFSAGVGQIMRAVVERERLAGRSFRRFRIHDLRHGFAVRALANGMNIYAVSRHLGHTSVKTTEIYLDHLTGDQAHSAIHGLPKVGQTMAQTPVSEPATITEVSTLSV